MKAGAKLKKRKAKDLYPSEKGVKKSDNDNKDINKRLQANESILKYFRRSSAADRMLRVSPKKRKFFEEPEHQEENESDEYEDDKDEDFEVKPKRKNDRPAPKMKEEVEENDNENDQGQEDEIYDRLPKNKKQLLKLLEKVNQRIQHYKLTFFQEQADLEGKKSKVSESAIPICSDIRYFDFEKLAQSQANYGSRLFDVIMMDPPWQLSSSQPSRGVAIAYDSLSDDHIMKMPIEKLQKDGYIFIWAINAKYRFSCKLIEHWGYTLIDEVTWVKKTVNGKIAKGHGFYLQHAKESCLIGVKGKVSDKAKINVCNDVIFSERRGQSQKPEEIYEYIESLVPYGFYLEIFGRRNNLRKNWVTIGNEL